MAYNQSVLANVRRASSSAGVSNLNNSMFISAHAYFAERVKAYNSMNEVNQDPSVPKDSNLYKAMQSAFSVSSPAIPIYSGRREVDDVTLVPTVADNTTYTVNLQVVDETTGIASEEWLATFTSGVSATAAEIVLGLEAAITALTIPASELTTDGTTDPDVLQVIPSADRQLILTNAPDFTQEYTVTENAATCFSEITDENKEDYYFVTSESRDETWVDDLAKAVEATEGSYPKQYRVSSSAIESLQPLADPAVAGDLIGKLKEGEYKRSAGEWHDQADEIFPELATCVKGGSYFAGVANWKFLQGTAPVAKHPIKGRTLTSAEWGYILDRNASVVGTELGLNFLMGGTNSTGQAEFTDLVMITDHTKLVMEARVLTALINANNGGLPLTMTSSDMSVIKERCESVLSDGVNRKTFAGFEPIVMPTKISFEDQASRLLQDVKFTAYFASKINNVIIDGVLTYNEEIQ